MRPKILLLYNTARRHWCLTQRAVRPLSGLLIKSHEYPSPTPNILRCLSTLSFQSSVADRVLRPTSEPHQINLFSRTAPRYRASTIFAITRFSHTVCNLRFQRAYPHIKCIQFALSTIAYRARDRMYDKLSHKDSH